MLKITKKQIFYRSFLTLFIIISLVLGIFIYIQYQEKELTEEELIEKLEEDNADIKQLNFLLEQKYDDLLEVYNNSFDDEYEPLEYDKYRLINYIDLSENTYSYKGSSNYTNETRVLVINDEPENVLEEMVLDYYLNIIEKDYDSLNNMHLKIEGKNFISFYENGEEEGWSDTTISLESITSYYTAAKAQEFLEENAVDVDDLLLKSTTEDFTDLFVIEVDYKPGFYSYSGSATHEENTVLKSIFIIVKVDEDYKIYKYN